MVFEASNRGDYFPRKNKGQGCPSKIMRIRRDEWIGGSHRLSKSGRNRATLEK
jgi:hypothetical protein